MIKKEYDIIQLFSTPLYVTHRDSGLDPTEKKEIEDIIEEGMHNSRSVNSYIFNIKLKKIKEFCEQHIKTYVKEVITPKEELDFYITQSWLNVVEPGGNIHRHWHSNSIISGVFYPRTVETDLIFLYDPNDRLKRVIQLQSDKSNNSWWNAYGVGFNVASNVLILFPSWLEHGVEPNEKATTDRISIAFNVFAKGNFGETTNLNELIL